MSLGDFASLRDHFGSSQLYREYKYDANGRLEYMGITSRGVATSDGYWIIYRYTYNANNAIATEKTAPKNSIFDNRALLSYA